MSACSDGFAICVSILINLQKYEVYAQLKCPKEMLKNFHINADCTTKWKTKKTVLTRGLKWEKIAINYACTSKSQNVRFN